MKSPHFLRTPFFLMDGTKSYVEVIRRDMEFREERIIKNQLLAGTFKSVSLYRS